jgi:hypothetical protein
MRIESYSFGKIVIEGKAYTSDVIIYPGKVDSSWWRKEGHSLVMDDLQDIISAKPGVLIIGTGFFGLMKVPQETKAKLESLGIEVQAARTGEAVKLFNQLGEGRIAVAALHLTC